MAVTKIQKVIEMRPEGSFLKNGFIEFCNFLKEHNVKRILEIGSYAGESVKMYKEILGPDVLVVSIDPWDELNDEHDLIHNTDLKPVERKFNDVTLNMQNIVKCKAYSQDIADMFADGYFDCVYIDGLHTYDQVKLDFKNYINKVKSGGIIAGHDYMIDYTQQQINEIIDFDNNHMLRKEVTKAVSDSLSEYTAGDEYKPNYVFGDSSWASIKKISIKLKK